MRRVNPLIKADDLDQFEQLVGDYRVGKSTSQRFVGERLLMGIYGQRQQGMMMVRAKLPGGQIYPYQLLGLAEAVESYSASETLHLTTRQDVQFYSISLTNSVPLLRHLARFDISTREAGGNTVRNITSCPYAGVCPQQQVDVNQHISHVAKHFVRHPLTQALPRKFKMSFSACGHDCANGLVQDLGFIATRHNGKKGFRVMVGGGLGASPIEALELEPFIDESALIPVIEAVIALHDRFSDRERRSRSRLKFMLKSWGRDKFLDHYRHELARTTSAYDVAAALQGEWQSASVGEQPPSLTAPLRERDGRHLSLPISVPQGQLSADQLRSLARLCEYYGVSRLKLSQQQGLILSGIESRQLGPLTLGLKQIGVEPLRQGVSSCPGSVSCPLGITDSRSVAVELAKHNFSTDVSINGCQNGCANANISDLGLAGRGVRHHAKLVPSYTLHIGGSGAADGQVAMVGPDIPAQRVVNAVSRIEQNYLQQRQEQESFHHWSRVRGEDYFTQLLADLVEVKPEEIDGLIRDHGDAQIFRVQRVGVGECAGTRADPVDKLLLDSSYEMSMATAFAIKGKRSDAVVALERVLLTGGKALLMALGEVDNSQELESLEALQPLLAASEHSDVRGVEPLVSQLDGVRAAPDELNYPPLERDIHSWFLSNQATIRAHQADRLRAVVRSSA